MKDPDLKPIKIGIYLTLAEENALEAGAEYLHFEYKTEVLKGLVRVYAGNKKEQMRLNALIDGLKRKK